MMKMFYLAAALWIPAASFANGGGYVGGTDSNGALGVFRPKNAQQIEMQTEDLQIALHLEYGHIEVEYTLHNPGKTAVSVEVGFPCIAAVELTGDGSGGFGKEASSTPPLRNFEVQLDGEKLPWSTVRDSEKQKDETAPQVRGEMGPFRRVPYWYTFKLPFEPGQSRKLHVRYETDYRVTEGSISDDSDSLAETLTYLFSTAAVWKGPIGQGKVTIRAVSVPADQVRFNLPKRFSRQGNTWSWEFKDLEPGLGDDLNIAVHPARVSYGRPLPDAAPRKEGEPPQYAEFVRMNGKWTLEHRDYTATASSRLAATKKGDDEITYEAANLADNSSDTAWVEGVEGDGVGESLTLNLRIPRKVTQIAVQNGYLKSDMVDLYTNNGRVAEFAVSINGGKPFTAALPDERSNRHPHLISLPEEIAVVKTISLTIQKVYPGAKYHDTCISGITLITPLVKAPKVTSAR